MKNHLFLSKKFSRKILAIFLVVVSGISLLMPTVSANEVKINDNIIETEKTIGNDSESYFEQYDELSGFSKLASPINLNIDTVTNSENVIDKKTSIEGVEGIKLDKDNQWVEWNFEVTESGVASAEILYAPIADKSTDIMVKFTIDGKAPSTEANSLYLPRLWKREYADGERPFDIDAQGNEIAPEQIQVSMWNSVYLDDSQGLYEEPYLFYFEKGVHTVRLSVIDSSLVLGGIKFHNEKYISYKEYYKKYSKDIVKNGETVYQQAEVTELTNSASINPTYDKLNVATVPSDPTYVKLNTIGQTNWNAQGDSISWKANVEKAGMYRVVFRARQNINSGLISYRNLYVNGKVPFAEALNIPFEYSQDWKIYTLGGEEERLLYLEPGDIITLSCSSGETAKILRAVRLAINDLNALYRRVIAITSVSPDTFQDYKLEKKIPDIDNQLLDITKRLRSTHSELLKILDSKGSMASSINYVADVTEELGEKPYLIPERLGSFKNGIESLGSLMQSLSTQPLEIDYLAYMPISSEIPEANAGFFENFKFNTIQFLTSFVKDYEGINGWNTEKTINVWVSTGRDQAQILSNLIMSNFTVESGIGVKLNMVDTGTTLVRASLAGKGPDVALMMPQTTPVELAARGAIVDLKDYVTEDMKNDFNEASWTPFYYNGGLYAVPETQTFQVLVYRTDIFEELGITVPSTWDEFYEAMAIIQNNNLAVGLAEIDATNLGVSLSLGVFSSFLMQRGVKNYYNDDLSKTIFDTEVAYQAFTDLTRLYKDYGLDRQLDFYSRFRSGEVPMAIRGFNDVVQIQYAAPEIRGLWAMAPYPGTQKEDGSVDRTQCSASTGSIILKAAEKRGLKDEAFEFIKWWVSEETQYEYSRDLETALGSVGRYYSANLKAFEKSNWSTADMELITSHYPYLKNQPTIPGSYALTRDLTSALREVISGKNRPRRALMLYNTDINEEIARKRKEFGLES